MFQVEKLTKSFGEDLVAVDEVSFATGKGEIYGLLGPNGAGKTTTMSMLSGLLAPDSGRLRFDGIDLLEQPIRVKQQLGIVPQEIALYEELSARENLQFWGSLYGLGGKELKRSIDRSLDLVGLTSRAKDPPKQYSGGMKRRLNLALGLIHQPRTILLDEPTVGIDPQARLNILEVVEQVAAGGSTVLYTTHYLEEAERLCDRIAIMDHGKILAEGSLDELKSQAGEEEVVTITGRFDIAESHTLVEHLEGTRMVTAEAGKLVLTSPSGEAVKVLSEVFGSRFEVHGVAIQPPSLNSLFLHLTGRELRD